MTTVASQDRSPPAPRLRSRIPPPWFILFLIAYGIWVSLPFLAPILMQYGWTGTGKIIYLIYSFFCHQLPERSFFFFGEKTMYTLGEIQAAWQDTANPLLLRQFLGNATMGWKVAWSDRMVSFYTSIWLFAFLAYPFRRKGKPLPWWGGLLLLLPMLVDGGTHALSDLAGIGQGFRDTNRWLAVLTNDSLPGTFYAGDALGSFNSVMRLSTGFMAGLGIVWLVFPYLFRSHTPYRQLDEQSYAQIIEQIKRQDPHSSGG